MKKVIFFISVCGMLLFFNGCSEKKEIVIKKTEEIPSEDIREETKPLVVILQHDKDVSKPEQKKTEETEVKIVENVQTKIVEEKEKTNYDTRLFETSNVQTKIVEQKISPKKSEIVEKVQPLPQRYEDLIVLVSGECLIYKVKWNFSNVGKLLLVCKKETINNNDVYHLVGITVPEGLWTKFGNGYNRFDSYINSKDNLPFYYYNYSASPSTSQITKTMINHKTKTLSYEIRKYKQGKQYACKTGNVKFSDKIFDGLSAIYAMRGIANEKMPHSKIPVGITKITEIFLQFLKKDRDSFAVGEREYWLIQSEASEDEALFKKGKLFISISADEERLPLLLKGKVPLGTATMELVSRKSLSENFPTDSKSLTHLLTSSF